VSDRPSPDGTDIRKLTEADVPEVAHALALAFYDDPHMRWILRNDRNRLRRLERAFSLFIRRMWLGHEASYTHEHLVGAALWMPPRRWFVSPPAQLRMAPAVIGAVRGDVVRLMRAFAFMERKHPRKPVHWYLPMIGVAPAWQGRGYGQALLHPVLELCDKHRVAAYLEASTPRNRALYERSGFEVVEECSYAPDAPPLWRMWREPGGS
jgi:ribosomal protein S18 acetylase RimI-like enzyme